MRKYGRLKFEVYGTIIPKLFWAYMYGLVYLVWKESPPAQSSEDLFSEIESLKELPKSALED